MVATAVDLSLKVADSEVLLIVKSQISVLWPISIIELLQLIFFLSLSARHESADEILKLDFSRGVYT